MSDGDDAADEQRLSRRRRTTTRERRPRYRRGRRVISDGVTDKRLQ
ncbi:hypothetical protein HSB1_31040 [Halogranum salarium B-1]|uniref:Uncharacterized protein n=1 Tax=Halogranum salarium B-1 TaxID=1210908 RepID=J3JES7_9EURY|nr:hypothetical protein HSB1_31040 [Halogranum salarium B-1]